jgi:hypothetical protein
MWVKKVASQIAVVEDLGGSEGGKIASGEEDGRRKEEGRI